MKSSTGQIKLPSTLDMGTTVPIAITGWEQSGMQHNINLSVPRQGDRNELLAKVAKRAERAQLLVLINAVTCTSFKYIHVWLYDCIVSCSMLLQSQVIESISLHHTIVTHVKCGQEIICQYPSNRHHKTTLCMTHITLYYRQQNTCTTHTGHHDYHTPHMIILSCSTGHLHTM